MKKLSQKMVRIRVRDRVNFDVWLGLGSVRIMAFHHY